MGAIQQFLGLLTIFSFFYTFIAIGCIYNIVKSKKYDVEWGGAYLLSMLIQFSDLNKKEKQKINWLKHLIWSYIIMMSSIITLMITA